MSSTPATLYSLLQSCGLLSLWGRKGGKAAAQTPGPLVFPPHPRLRSHSQILWTAFWNPSRPQRHPGRATGVSSCEAFWIFFLNKAHFTARGICHARVYAHAHPPSSPESAWILPPQAFEMAAVSHKREVETPKKNPKKDPMFYVTRDSQKSKTPKERKQSYIGMRNLSDLEKITEEDIIGPKGTIRGIKNRVRAGLANFDNPVALRKVQGGGARLALVWLAIACSQSFLLCSFLN